MGIEQGLRKRVQRAPVYDADMIMGGKIQPQAIKIEEAILGACMMNADAYETAAEILTPESFYTNTHQKIFAAFNRLHKAHVVIEELAVMQELNKSEELELIGGPYYLTTLTGKTSSSSLNNIEAHCRTVQEKYLARQVIKVGTEAMAQAYEDAADVYELIDSFASQANKIGEGSNGKEFSDMVDGMVEFHNELERKAAITEDLVGIPSGFKEIDKVTHGFRPGSLITIAAGTSDGKTAIALNIAANASKMPYFTCVAIFTLEVDRAQIINRIVSAETGVGFEKIDTGKLTPKESEKVMHATKYLESLPLFIDDTPGINYVQIRSKVKRLMRKRAKQRIAQGLDPNERWMIVIDYLQLMKGAIKDKRATKEEEISDTTGNLKILAKELKIPIIQLAQVNREVAKRKGNRLMLSDLRSSASIEMDSDMVIFIYKPDDGVIMERVVEIAKHRGGKLHTTRLRVEFWRQKFLNPDDEKGEAPAPISQPWVRVGQVTTGDFDEGFDADKAPFE